MRRMRLALAGLLLGALPHARTDARESDFAAAVNDTMILIQSQAANEASRYTLGLAEGGISIEVCRNSRGSSYNKIPPEEVARTKQGECVDWRGQDLRGFDFSGADLRGAMLWGANLAGANLKKANLKWANITKARLTGADLESSELSHATLDGTNLDGANLNWARLENVDSSETSLIQAQLRGTYLAGSTLRQAKLFGADLRGAQLSAVVFGWSNLDEADLRGANLLGTAFNGYLNSNGLQYGPSSLRAAKFKGAWYNDKTTLPFDEAEAKRLGMVKH